MDDTKIETGGGAAIGGDVSTGGGNVAGRDRTSTRSDSNPRQDVHISNGGENWIWRMMEMAQQIRELTRDMDNLPARVLRLEQMEVVVRPAVPEVIFRPPHSPPESVNLSMRTVFIILILAVGIPVLLVALLVFLRLTNA